MHPCRSDSKFAGRKCCEPFIIIAEQVHKFYRKFRLGEQFMNIKSHLVPPIWKFDAFMSGKIPLFPTKTQKGTRIFRVPFAYKNRIILENQALFLLEVALQHAIQVGTVADSVPVLESQSCLDQCWLFISTWIRRDSSARSKMTAPRIISSSRL